MVNNSSKSCKPRVVSRGAGEGDAETGSVAEGFVDDGAEVGQEFDFVVARYEDFTFVCLLLLTVLVLQILPMSYVEPSQIILLQVVKLFEVL